MNIIERFNGVRDGTQNEFNSVAGQIWQTLGLLAIVGYIGISLYTVLQLRYFCEDCSDPIAIFILCMFVCFVHVMADVVWEVVLPMVKSNYWCEWLAISIFVLFIVGGLMVFAIFLYESYLFWVAVAFTWRIIPLVVSIIAFARFIHTVLHS